MPSFCFSRGSSREIEVEIHLLCLLQPFCTSQIKRNHVMAFVQGSMIGAAGRRQSPARSAGVELLASRGFLLVGKGAIGRSVLERDVWVENVFMPSNINLSLSLGQTSQLQVTVESYIGLRSPDHAK